jgi:hypothetical protein
MDNYVPPLKLWLYVLAPAVFVVGGFWGYAQLIYPQPYMVSRGFSESLKKAIVENNTVGPHEKSIIVFGSSLPRYDLPFISEIRDKISAQNIKVNILRISINRLNMEEAEHSNFFDYITKFPPDYLFFEVNNLNIDNDTETPVLAVDLLVDDIVRYVRKRSKSEEPDFNEVPPVKNHRFYWDGLNMELFGFIATSKHHVRAFSDNKIANASFAKLIKQKTKIIFLNFPVCTKLDSIFFNKDQKNKLQLLLDSYSRAYGIKCWNYPENMSISDFFDGVHLNYKGSKKYSEWFVSEFNKLK